MYHNEKLFSNCDTPVLQKMAESVITVFHDSANYNAKHKLQRSWTLWYDNPQKKSTASNWLANLKRIASFQTVEDFWGLYNNLLKPSAIPVGSNYHLFKTNVQPMWEDSENVKGGKWTLTLPKHRKDSLDSLWLNGLLAIIGEAFDDKMNDEICGIVLSPRQKQDRIALWTKSTHPSDSIEGIGKKFKKLLAIDDDLRISFQPHEESLKHSIEANAGPHRHGHGHQSGGGGHGRGDSRDMYTV